MFPRSKSATGGAAAAAKRLIITWFHFGPSQAGWWGPIIDTDATQYELLHLLWGGRVGGWISDRGGNKGLILRMNCDDDDNDDTDVWSKLININSTVGEQLVVWWWWWWLGWWQWQRMWINVNCTYASKTSVSNQGTRLSGLMQHLFYVWDRLNLFEYLKPAEGLQL